MGKSAGDLPELLHPVGSVDAIAASPAPKEAAAADEIISQMADEQIDRLMAAEGGAAGAKEASAVADQSPAAQIMAAAAAVMGPAAAGQGGANTNEGAGARGQAAPGATAKTASAAVQESERGAASDSVVEELKQAAESVAGRGAVRGTGGSGARSPNQKQAPSWLVRTLEWINSPMRDCPEELRQGIGKIALLTIFNAAAVLIYVLIFRRGHH
jgi:hypothetical protein